MIGIVEVIEIISLFFAGILAGEEFTVYYGVRTPLASLDTIPQLQMRQALIGRLRIIAPAIFVPSLLLGIAATVFGGTGPPLIFRLVGLLGFIAWALATLPGTVPINSAIAAWDPKVPPENWRGTVKRWERFAFIRPWATMFAFAMFVIAITI